MKIYTNVCGLALHVPAKIYEILNPLGVELLRDALAAWALSLTTMITESAQISKALLKDGPYTDVTKKSAALGMFHLGLRKWGNCKEYIRKSIDFGFAGFGCSGEQLDILHQTLKLATALSTDVATVD